MKKVVVDFSASKFDSLKELGKLPQIFDVHGLPVKEINNYIRQNCHMWGCQTIRAYSHHLLNFCKWLYLVKKLKFYNISREDLARYAHYLASNKKRRYKSSSCILSLNVAQNFIVWSAKNSSESLDLGLIKTPVRIFLKSANSRLGILDNPINETIKFARLSDARKFYQKINTEEISGLNFKRNGLLVRLMYESGLRVSEAVSIRIDDLYAINVESNFSIASIIGKGQKRRFVPIPNDLVREIQGYIEIERQAIVEKTANKVKSEKIFLGVHGGGLTTGYVQKLFRNLNKLLSFGITPHTLRHTFATYFQLKRRDIVALQKILGHSNQETTNVYVGAAALIDESETFTKYLLSLQSDAKALDDA